MKRNIVESYSIEEAFRALNKKSSKKNLSESLSDSDIVEIPGSKVVYPEFFADEVEDYSGGYDKLKSGSVHKYYIDKGTPREDLIITKMFATSEWVEAAEEYDDYSIIELCGYQLANGDYLYCDASTQAGDLFIKCKDYDSLKRHILSRNAGSLYPDGEFVEESAKSAVKDTKKVVESVNDDLTNIIETQDAEAAADWILKNTACADPKSDIIEMCRDYGCKAQIYDILALDKYFRVAAPKLTKWWTIWDEDGAFGAAWNMLLVDSDNNIYGACAETQGGPFIYGLAFISPEELADYLAEHPVTGNYTPADVSDAVDAVEGHGGYNNPLAQKICDECEAILPDLDDEDYM